MENTQEPRLQVAMVPTPGMGHLIPLVELAKRLVYHHKFAVTFFVPSDGSSMKLQKQLLQSLPNSISTIFLPPVSFDDLPEDVKVETRIALSLTRSIPTLRDSFKVLTESTRVVAMVVDFFGMDAFAVAREFGIEPYIFFAGTAMVLSLIFHIPKLDEMFADEYRYLPEPVKLPGCVPVQGIDLIDPIQDRKNIAYQAVLSLCKGHRLAAGIMVNSFMDLEPGAFKALMDPTSNLPPICPVGPLWLDEQPSGSVLYVCFGSGGTLSQDQVNELAIGLETSRQRFLWVVKSPHDKATNATYFGVESIGDPFDFLPNGFLERTKGVGLVVPSWAPQAQILSHGSTGGFVTHCGWNSTLESIVHGVPLIAWPLYAEQRMNAVLLADDLQVALRVKAKENGVVGREDIAEYAKGLIAGEEGKLLRNRMQKLKDAAENVLSPDGSSTKSLAQMVEIWNNQ
ncbi:hypothetical protein SLEP1_g40419 [Rubroshorea leprosula]|uniref:Glycosyltransferase n=1 Tax=Rubroshorea leprosula TaxID=152421 RepID=A0AAV5L469_9ROSI|nr:hypothetical protein SLEP1_g40419 [Rubroshorea leprosula]